MISSERMAAVDRNAAALGVPRKQLMESSGNAVARCARSIVDESASIAIVGGRGNNGGDAFVAARFLDEYSVEVFLVGRPESIATDIARGNWEALQRAEYESITVRHPDDLDVTGFDVIVDGVLGTGITGAPREPEATVIDRINEAESTVISVDVPSGLDADTGTGSTVVHPDHVVTFHDMKPGLEDSSEFEVTVADIGIPEAAEVFVGPGDVWSVSRDPASHKGDFGRVLVVGGGPYTGAPALSALGALRGGADLAYVLAPEAVSREIQGYSPDLIVRDYEGDHLAPRVLDRVREEAEQCDVVILGPGLGSETDTLETVREFLAEYRGRCVVDADALRVVPSVETDASLVCTPHQGELEEMGGQTATAWRDRASAVASFARELGHVLLVKGRYDIVSDGSTTRVNRTGNPGMTVGGTGDVLAGIVGTLLATQDPLDAACIGAYVNGRAGDSVVQEQGYGLVASDLLAAIPGALWEDR